MGFNDFLVVCLTIIICSGMKILDGTIHTAVQDVSKACARDDSEMRHWNYMTNSGGTVKLLPGHVDRCHLVIYLAGREAPRPRPAQFVPDLCREFEACLDREEQNKQERRALRSSVERFGAELQDVFLPTVVLLTRDMVGRSRSGEQRVMHKNLVWDSDDWLDEFYDWTERIW